MNIELENDFIETFIVKSRRERLKYELTNPEKRFLAIDRFSHHTSELIEQKYIVFKDKKITIEEAEKMLVKLSGSDECYYMSEEIAESDSYDLHECLKKYYYNGPSIFICKNGVVFIVSEYAEGAAEKFLLVKNKPVAV